ncbi:hypothetical protein C8J56DRAFT_964690 [Mycena floridula]|nr:hypothetical protein C8J56DRAFT_964690 [Mycena floridula]
MSAIGNTPFKIHMILPSPADLTPEILAPCIATHQVRSLFTRRWYIGLTEVTTVLVGEALILIRINALYGWSQLLIMLLGGAKNLAGSEDILNCSKTASNVPDVNIGMWCTSIIVAFIYFCLLMRKSIIFAQEASYALGAIRHPIGFWNRTLASFGTFWTVLKFSFSNCPEANMAPTVYLCLRDGALYFLVVVTVLVLNLLFSVFFKEFAQVGTPWLIATYTIASTRIFLNLKVSARKVRIHGLGTGTDSWQEFEDMSQLEFNNRQMIRH